jgi:hypothetical protein
VIDSLTAVVAGSALALAVWCAVAVYRDEPTKDRHFVGMAVVAVLAVAQLIVGIVRMVNGGSPDQGAGVFVAYLLGATAAVPVAGYMSLAERTRWGSATVAAGAVVLAVLEVRLIDIWGGGGG